MKLLPVWGCFCVFKGSLHLVKHRAGGSKATHLGSSKGREPAAPPRLLSSWWLGCLSTFSLVNAALMLPSDCNHAHTCVCACVCISLIHPYSEITFLVCCQSSKSWWCLAEVSHAVSHKECFFINRNHKKFKYVRYALCVIIWSEIYDRCFLKDHGKFLWAEEQLYKPKERMLTDFLYVHVISATRRAFSRAKFCWSEMNGFQKERSFIFMPHPIKHH